jgi:hypothetical protein
MILLSREAGTNALPINFGAGTNALPINFGAGTNALLINLGAGTNALHINFRHVCEHATPNQITMHQLQECM